jgi:hypothetical protein
MKRLIIMLALVILALGATAAPALADYFTDMRPGEAYVHPWGGTEPAWWEGVDTEGNYFQTTDPVPAGDTVYLAAWMSGWPRLQVVLWPATIRLDCTLAGPDGKSMVSLTARQAKRYWCKAFDTGWPTETIYQKETTDWVVVWKYPLGELAPGTYCGTGEWTFFAPYLDFELPYHSQKLPDVISASQLNGPTTHYTYHFTVE